jgi:hypothetical protein
VPGQAASRGGGRDQGEAARAGPRTWRVGAGEEEGGAGEGEGDGEAHHGGRGGADKRRRGRGCSGRRGRLGEERETCVVGEREMNRGRPGQ